MITLLSFAYKKGVPLVDHVFDCRTIPNPHHVPTLRDLTGRDEPVQHYVTLSAATDEITTQAARRIMEGAEHLAFGCYGGRHRSVAVAELVGRSLKRYGIPHVIVHRELK
ncbi:RNase adapter RapZ [Hyphomicrobium sp. ghe19]|uniref:RapZ C-terminal domain-containing protein n=1 Tax=Hyphomicrobium sp. ghe19 TaxID=2682968 RepID=UPI001366AC85|nr:Nucleotide-binding protein YvcJ [Hyphomicrobium sp. ghe19]